MEEKMNEGKRNGMVRLGESKEAKGYRLNTGDAT